MQKNIKESEEKEGGRIWILYQKYAEMGLTSTKTHTYPGNDGEIHYILRDLGDGFAMFDGAVNVLDSEMENIRHKERFPCHIFPSKTLYFLSKLGDGIALRQDK